MQSHPDPMYCSRRGSITGLLEMLSLEKTCLALEHINDDPSIYDFFMILQTCKREKERMSAECLHTHICFNGLEGHRMLGNYLVPLLVECGSLSHAQQAFNRLSCANEHSWTSIIQGYVDCGAICHAFKFFEKMQEKGVLPSRYTFLFLLEGCTEFRCLEIGRDLHAKIKKAGYAGNLYVGNALVNMYMKCESPRDAQEVFDEIKVKDVVMWNTLIAGYAECGYAEEALDWLEKMHLEGIYGDAITVISGLKACGSLGAVVRGQEIHIDAAKEGFEEDSFVGNTLVYMYAKCGFLSEAQDTFDELLVKDAVSWNALMAGYSEQEFDDKVLYCLEKMRSDKVLYNTTTFVAGLKACGKLGIMKKGQELHGEIVMYGLEKELFVGHTLVDIYIKHGFFAEAWSTFDTLPVQGIVPWTALIMGYVEYGLAEDALICLEQMEQVGVPPSAVSYICSLKACIAIGAVEMGQKLHAEITKNGLEVEHSLGNTLVGMYAKCGLVLDAQDVFDDLPIQDIVSWTALISGCCDYNLSEKALMSLKQMQLESNTALDSVALVCALKACCRLRALAMAQELHEEIVKEGYETDVLIGNALVDVYAKCGLFEEASFVMYNMVVRDVASWNALINGYTEKGLSKEALATLKQMKEMGVPLDAITFACGLKACGCMSALNIGQELHMEIAEVGLECDLYVGSLLVYMYAKCGSFKEAEKVHAELQVRDEISWTGLMTGYSEGGLLAEALYCLERMQLEGVYLDVGSWNALMLGFGEEGESDKVCKLNAQMQEQGVLPDISVFISSAKAHGVTGALESGKRTHTLTFHLIRLEAAEETLAVSFMDMYIRCGSMAYARMVFESLGARTVSAWNVLISGYARQGESGHAFNLLNEMGKEGRQPDDVTMLSILSACSHAGLLDKGYELLRAMNQVYQLYTNLKHHNCVVDLLSRAGRLEEANGLVERLVKYQPNVVTWSTMLGGCKKWSSVELGKQAFDNIVKLDKQDAAAFTLMSDIYADIV